MGANKVSGGGEEAVFEMIASIIITHWPYQAMLCTWGMVTDSVFIGVTVTENAKPS